MKTTTPRSKQSTPAIKRPAMPTEAAMRRIVSSLTSAEARVFRGLLFGLSARELGAKLDISPHTVNNHTRHIFEKFDATSRMQIMTHFIDHRRVDALIREATALDDAGLRKQPRVGRPPKALSGKSRVAKRSVSKARTLSR